MDSCVIFSLAPVHQLQHECLVSTDPHCRQTYHTPAVHCTGHTRTAWMDNIKTWTGLSVEESVRMTEDRDKWRKYVRGVANPRIEDG